VNADGRVNVFYSTPVEYTAAKFKENITWPVKTDDFMPLANDEHSYWTGFYTSRPALKRYERQLAGYLQAARQVQLLADMPVNDVVKAALSSKKDRPWFHFWAGLDRHDMDPLAAAVALTQHHDAVSGTEMQHVAYDYAARLAAGAAVADAACVKALLALARAPPDTPMQLCRLVNESVCDASIGRSSAGLPFNVVIYNPLSKARDGLPVRIPVAVAVEGGSVFRVTNLESGVAVASFLLPSTAIASAQQELQNQAKSAMFELVFQVSLAPFALQSFQVEQGPASRSTLASNPPGSAGTAPWESHGAQTSFYSHSLVPSMPRGGTRAKPAAHERSRGRRVGHGARARTVRASRAGAGEDAPDMLSIENEFIKVGFDSVSGRMLWMLNKEDGVSVDMDHNLHWYESAQAGDAKNTCGEGEQKSGAYIFRPNHTSPDGQSAKCVSADCGASLRVLKAPVVQQVEQTFSAWATQTVRLYQGAKSVEIEWTVGPIPVEDGVGKEVVSRFSTNVSSAGEFKTDSNGRDTLVRKRCITKVGAMDSSCRASVPEYNVTEPVAGNFYPINTVISIQDEKAALGVAVDRAQAGASLVDGQIELMLHRRLLCDDARGVAEPLNETQSISPYDWVDAKGKAHHEPYRIGKGLVVRGKHQVFLTAPASAARAYRALQDEIYYEPVVAVADAFAPTPAPAPGPSSEAPVWRAGCAGGNVDLPENVMILTVEKQPPAAAAASSRRGRKAKARSAGPLVLLRVAHRFGVGEDAYVE
jgi:alpha-mannosidase